MANRWRKVEGAKGAVINWNNMRDRYADIKQLLDARIRFSAAL